MRVQHKVSGVGVVETTSLGSDGGVVVVAAGAGGFDGGGGGGQVGRSAVADAGDPGRHPDAGAAEGGDPHVLPVRGWARRWEAVSGLGFRFVGLYSGAVVGDVLARCAALVRRFEIEVRPRLRPRAAYWLRALAEKRVRSLKLAYESSHADDDDGAVLPRVGRAIYDCEQLTDLHFRYCELPRPPPQGQFAGFPHLTRLALNRVNLPFAGAGALLERVIASARALADLLLADVSVGVAASEEEEEEPWAIRAPRLRTLTLWMGGDNGGRVAGEMPLLEVAHISVDCLLGTEEFLHTLRRLSGVKVFHLCINNREFNENPLQGIRWKFQNLRVSTLTVDFGRISSIMSMLTLLRRAPQIEQLHIEVDRQETMGEEISEAILDAGMPDDSVKTLKRVMLTFAKCFPSEMFFVKLLLSKATSLESLQVMLYWESMMPSPEACIQFAMYKNDAASKAKFEVHGGMGTFNIVS